MHSWPYAPFICQLLLEAVQMHVLLYDILVHLLFFNFVNYCCPFNDVSDCVTCLFHRMGDYHRYKAEIASDEDRKKCAAESLKAYEQAKSCAEESLEPTNPVRLGLALNFSVFYYEILNSKECACKAAKEAFEAAMNELDSLQDVNYKDSTLIMQLLRDNLTLWTNDDKDEQGNTN